PWLTICGSARRVKDTPSGRDGWLPYPPPVTKKAGPSDNGKDTTARRQLSTRTDARTAGPRKDRRHERPWIPATHPRRPVPLPGLSNPGGARLSDLCTVRTPAPRSRGPEPVAHRQPDRRIAQPYPGPADRACRRP